MRSAAPIVIMICSALIAPRAWAGNATAEPMFEAMMAQHDGNYAKCAAKADEARRLPTSTYRAHRLFAVCTVNAADAQRSKLSPAD